MPAIALLLTTCPDDEIRALLSPAGTSRADLLQRARRQGFPVEAVDACLYRLQQARRVVVCLQTDPSTIYPIARPLSTPRAPRVEDRPIHVRGAR